MTRMSWVTSWESWRTVLGRSGTAQRARIDALLETRPCLLYWGDSWFSSPLYLNLARQSASRIDGLGMLIGRPGATAEGLFTAAQVRDRAARIANSPFDLVCLSAGGNDALSGRLAAVFADWVSGRRSDRLTPWQAFERLAGSTVFPGIAAAYGRALDAIGAVHARRPTLRVLAHGYVPIRRIGVPARLDVTGLGLAALLKEDAGPWLWPTMRHVLADEAGAATFARHMLVDGMRDRVLAPLAGGDAYGGFFGVADFSAVAEAADPGFWYDEIHPTEAGFAVLARVFNARMRALLPPAKRAAVE